MNSITIMDFKESLKNVVFVDFSKYYDSKSVFYRLLYFFKSYLLLVVVFVLLKDLFLFYRIDIERL